jgi:DNA recombination protein RmuC
MDGLVPLLVAGVLLGGLLVIVILAIGRLRADLAEVRRRQDDTSGLLVLQSQLDSLREQLRSSLDGGRLEIDRRLEETNRVVSEVRQGLGAVDRQVRTVGDVARDLRGLQELLRSPKLRGGMGEAMLGELLAQVLPQAAFDLQYPFPGGERVDAAIRLGQRLVPIDAKFPLDNYRRMSEAGDESTRRAAGRAFRADVKKHIDDIARRYIRPGDGTYDFALMYIPAEAVYQDAILGEDERELELFDYALTRRVVPVSPQSFYAYLQVIVLGLRGLTIEGRAEEILERLGLLRRHLDRFVEAFELASRHLQNAQRQFEESGRRLDRLDNALGEIAADDGAEATATAPVAEPRSKGDRSVPF